MYGMHEELRLAHQPTSPVKGLSTMTKAQLHEVASRQGVACSLEMAGTRSSARSRRGRPCRPRWRCLRDGIAEYDLGEFFAVVVDAGGRRRFGVSDAH